MIRILEGTVMTITTDAIVIKVSGIGYLVHTINPSAYTIGSEHLLYTYLAVRETALDLYGFETESELEIFELLITLPKIGPKSAMQILSQASLPLLKEAVLQNDPTHLSKLSGIGKKSAEKIVSGLAELFERKGIVLESAATGDTDSNTGYINDVTDALIALGYTEADARRAIQYLKEEYPHITEAQEGIRTALKSLT